MKVLFIGGTGIISSGCVPLALSMGYEVALLNRGQSSRATATGVEQIHADIRNPESVKSALKGRHFDSVVDWIAFTPEHIQTDIDLFTGITNQYVFISSASAYQKPPSAVPITESTPLCNPYWEYSRNKIACEELLMKAYRDQGFPFFTVRPSHTYDETLLPFDLGWTVVDRMLKGKPVVVHGDGTSLWALTHHRDFAKGFVPLLGDHRTIGHAVHITTESLLSWNQIYDIVAQAAGVQCKKVHVPSPLIDRLDKNWGAALLGDKSHCAWFDNSKVRTWVPGFSCTIPFEIGAREILDWYDRNPQNKKVSEEANALQDQLIQIVS